MRPYSNIISYNLIRLTAVSNYKLAQLTFSEPSQSIMRKMLFVKNMVNELYSRTPPDWLSQMIRWEFFTTESLESMTQIEIELIIDRYKEIIRHFPGSDDDLQNTDHLDFPINNSRTKSLLPPSSSPSLVKTASFAQRLAIELVSLFDMEFTLDLSVPHNDGLDKIVYPSKDWSYVEPNHESVYEPSISSSFDFSEEEEEDEEEVDDDVSYDSTCSSLTLTPSMHTVDYTDLFDSISKAKKPFERMVSSLKKKKTTTNNKGLKRSPSVASKILKMLSPF